MVASGHVECPGAPNLLSRVLPLACCCDAAFHSMNAQFVVTHSARVGLCVHAAETCIATIECGNRCGLCWGTECLLNWRCVPSASCCGPCCCRRLARSCEEWLKYRYPAQGGKSAVCCSQPEWFPLDTWNALLEHRISSAGCRRWGIIAMQVSAASTRSSW